MHMVCPPSGPVAGVEDIVAPITNWATCMIMHSVHHFCHIACIASFLMGRGYDYPTAMAMAQDIMRQRMGHMGPGMMPGMGPGMMPGMSPGMMPGMGSGMMPGMGSGMMPGMGSGMMPGMGSGMMPGMGSGMMPGMGPGMMSDMTPGAGPAASGIYG